MYVKDEQLEPILHVLPVAPLLPAGEGVIEALGPVLDLLDEPLDEVLLLDRIVGMGQPEPPAGLVVPLGLVREDRLPPVPGSDVLEEYVADHDGPLDREAHHEAPVEGARVG